MQSTIAVRILNVLSLTALALAGGPQPLAAAPGDSETNLLSHSLQAKDAEAAWAELRQSSRRPQLPAEWQTTAPSKEEQAKFFAPYVFALVDRSKDFYTKFPQDSHAQDAKVQEFEIAVVGLQMGLTNPPARLDGLEEFLLSLTNAGNIHTLVQVEKFLLTDAAMTGQDRSGRRQKLSRGMSAGAASKEAKAAVTDMLERLDAVGKPVALQFTAVDGREVDLAKLKGKVVLIDFWATWCGPCVGEVPRVLEAYGKLHPKGFEIVGISLDREKSSLTNFVAGHKMEWPQFFDGQFWQNKYARQFGIESIPAMWLIDKQGNLRDMDARSDLGGKVEKLLAE